MLEVYVLTWYYTGLTGPVSPDKVWHSEQPTSTDSKFITECSSTGFLIWWTGVDNRIGWQEGIPGNETTFELIKNQCKHLYFTACRTLHRWRFMIG